VLSGKLCLKANKRTVQFIDFQKISLFSLSVRNRLKVTYFVRISMDDAFCPLPAPIFSFYVYEYERVTFLLSNCCYDIFINVRDNLGGISGSKSRRISMIFVHRETLLAPSVTFSD